MDRITKAANDDPTELNELLFADDQSIINENEEQLQHHTNRLDEECTRNQMKISITKTEVMKVSKNPEPLNISINDTLLKQVTEFKYLESIFAEDGRLDREIETRTQKANAVTYQLAPILYHKHIPMEVKTKLINSIFLPTLTYQCQTWTLNAAQERKITACEMKCLRKTLNVTRRDRLRNDDIRRQTDTQPVMNYIRHQRIKWFGHLMRMPQNQPAAKAFNQRESGFKGRGRPRKTWLDGVKEVLRTHNLTATDATHMAQERKLHLPSTSQK